MSGPAGGGTVGEGTGVLVGRNCVGCTKTVVAVGGASWMRAVAVSVGTAVSVGAGVLLGNGVSLGGVVGLGVTGVSVGTMISTCGKACTVTPTVGNGVGPLLPQAVAMRLRIISTILNRFLSIQQLL